MSDSDPFNIENKSSEIQKKSQKDIILDIQENIMNKRFMFKTLKALTKLNPNYKEEFHFESPLGDSMVLKLSCENDQILTLTTKGESDVILKISGEEKLVQKFIHDFVVEAISILALELSLCLEATFPTISEEQLMTHFREKLSKAISEAIYACSQDKA